MDIKTNPKDLRIGNLIQDVGEGAEIYTVDMVSETRIRAGAMTIYPAGFEINHYIPLIPEWLERFGFKGNGNSFTVRRVIIMPSNIENVEAWFTIYFDDGGAIYGSTKIYYIHQLQNLYYALTGTELQISEP